VNVTDLKGTDFQGTPAVWLHAAGQGDITAANVILVSSGKLDCSFALPLGAATGAWDLYVKNPDGQSAFLKKAFTMTTGSAANWFFAEGSARPGFDTYGPASTRTSRFKTPVARPRMSHSHI